ncbi:fatty acid desaturase [Gallibacterium anatis]|uniref:fatty acid desaturase n=1 Tax=Gallibacterium anatis TaxID=750 RepID=UPI003D7397A1
MLIGSRQRALATILHEASHGSLTKNKNLSKILGTYFSGYLIFQSWSSYKQSHIKNHHLKLGSDLDPDYTFYCKMGVFEKYNKKLIFGNF